MLTVDLDTSALAASITKNVLSTMHDSVVSVPGFAVVGGVTHMSGGVPHETLYTIESQRTLYKIDYGKDLKQGASFPHIIKRAGRTHPIGTRYAIRYVVGRRSSPAENPYMTMNRLAQMLFGKDLVEKSRWDDFVEQYMKNPMDTYKWISNPIPVGERRTRIMWEDAPDASWWTPPEIIPAGSQQGIANLQAFLEAYFKL